MPSRRQPPAPICGATEPPHAWGGHGPCDLEPGHGGWDMDLQTGVITRGHHTGNYGSWWETVTTLTPTVLGKIHKLLHRPLGTPAPAHCPLCPPAS